MPRRNQSQKISKQAFPMATCQHKRRFSNELAALRQSELQMLQQPNLQLGVYKCQLCGGWHLTSRRGNEF